MSEDELEQLRMRVNELERELAQRKLDDEVHEMEFRSLQLEIESNRAYISRLEKLEEEVVAPKDVHIRNLEAIIAQLEADRTADESRAPAEAERSSWIRRRGRT